MFNPGFTAPILCACPQVTVFHDLQHKRHPEYFRWFDLPFWNFFLFWSARFRAASWPFPRRRPPICGAGTACRPNRIRTVPSGRRSGLFRPGRAPPAGAVPARRLHAASAQESGWPAARIRYFPRGPSRVPPDRLRDTRLLLDGTARSARPAGTVGSRRVPGLDSARRAVRSLCARHGISLSQPVRRLRAAGAGGPGCRCARRLFRDRADGQHRRRCGTEVRPQGPLRDRGGHAPARGGRGTPQSDLWLQARERAAEFSWCTTAHGILEALRSAC